MRAYCCYFFDLNLSIERVEIIEAETDADAVEQAEALFAAADGLFRAMELWDQARHIRQAGRRDAHLTESLEQIRRWRMKAEELRTAADGLSHGPGRQAFLNSAETHEVLASTAEARLKRRYDSKPETG